MTLAKRPIGLKRGTVALVPYNMQWPLIFEAEKQLLLEIFGNKVISIEHIGSTSVPGLAAKPLIDILVGVDSVDAHKEFINDLVRLDYEHMPERITATRAFFPKGPRENRTHHLSFVQFDSDEWRCTLAFRDYLRSHPDCMLEYQSLKKQLARKYPEDRQKYTAAKDIFIQDTLRTCSKK